MDELNKIPPVTRSLLFATIGVTVPCLLNIVHPYIFLLWWKPVIRNWQVWRPITAFFYGGGGLQLLFDLFLLLRNSTDLETNKFYRKTADYAWALILINTLIIATNYPLGTPVLFNAFLIALVYLWARANEHANVSLLGMINCPARYLPYVYLLFDLLRGGMPAAIGSATGLLSAHLYYFFKDVLPATNGGRGPNYLPDTPAFLRTLLPDSVDPNVAGQTPQPGGSVRLAAGGVHAFAPAGRSFGGSSTRPAGDGQRLNSGGGLGSWLPFGRRSSSAAAGSTASARQSRPDRDAMLAAAEARLRQMRSNSIAGRNQAASAATSQAASSAEARARSSPAQPAASAGPDLSAGGLLPGANEARSTGVASGDGGQAVRRTGAGKGPGRAFSFEQAKDDKEKAEEQETASGSGGRVAELRKAPQDEDEPSESTTERRQHSWGSGRRLAE